MSNRFTAIDLERLPAPDLIKKLDYESIFEEIKADFLKYSPNYNAFVETDPAIALLQVAAYRELLIRQRINDAAKGVMLAKAIGSDLDNLAALFNVERLENEGDEELRKRTQLSLEAYTTAGSVGSYVFWGLSVQGVKDVSVVSHNPGVVLITILGHELDSGMPSSALLNDVELKLNAEEIRPLTDLVVVQSPDIVDYTIEADLYFYVGPDPSIVKNLAFSTVQAYVNQHHKLGHDITVSGLHSSLHQTGVQRVELKNFSEDIVVSPEQVTYCTNITLNEGGTDE